MGTLIAQGYDTLESGLMIFVGLLLGNTLVALLSETHVADELKVRLDARKISHSNGIITNFENNGHGGLL